ncbi:uncharacterized protein [Rutidosis leptorrhynchoides]|uniref:uncharacterized protein n=1 Tax=Rutidosis leptorrhynchoides TaxID=125765 RepID=UPI003A993506
MSSPTTQSSPRPPFSISAAVRNLLILGVLFFLARQFYLIYTTSATGNHHTKHKSDEYLVNYYFNIFQDLIFDGYLTTDSKTLTIGTQFHEYRAALKELGVWNKKSTKNNVYLPFKDDSFDIQFSSHTGLDSSVDPGRFASELSRTLKQEGYLVIHTESEDSYSLNSLLDLFDSFKLIQSKEITSYHWSVPDLREILLQKKNRVLRRKNLAGSCSVPAYKKELIRKLEPLIVDEPLKPWIDFKKNIKKMKYLSKMADISFKTRYVYIDVGARNYESSIGSWFKKLYPKQNKSFEIFAIEADKRFHQEYESKKKITLLPYAAWVRNESLFFEINRDPNNTYNEKIQGMGRIQSAQTSTNFIRDPNMIRGSGVFLLRKILL